MCQTGTSPEKRWQRTASTFLFVDIQTCAILAVLVCVLWLIKLNEIKWNIPLVLWSSSITICIIDFPVLNADCSRNWKPGFFKKSDNFFRCCSPVSTSRWFAQGEQYLQWFELLTATAENDNGDVIYDVNVPSSAVSGMSHWRHGKDRTL